MFWSDDEICFSNGFKILRVDNNQSTESTDGGRS